MIGRDKKSDRSHPRRPHHASASCPAWCCSAGAGRAPPHPQPPSCSAVRSSPNPSAGGGTARPSTRPRAGWLLCHCWRGLSLLQLKSSPQGEPGHSEEGTWEQSPASPLPWWPLPPLQPHQIILFYFLSFLKAGSECWSCPKGFPRLNLPQCRLCR